MNDIVDILTDVMEKNSIKYKKDELEKIASYANYIYKDKL